MGADYRKHLLLDGGNPLAEFPEFRKLLEVAERISDHYGEEREVGGIRITAFRKPQGGRFNTEQLLDIINGAAIPHGLRDAAIECFNAFGKGPDRTILFLLMLSDLRRGLLDPGTLTSAQFGSIYDGLAGTYRMPKVIAIYAQQCFGNRDGMPVDTWIETFLRWPLAVYPQTRTRTPMTAVFAHAHGLGKVERLLWVTSQARKVHSSACDDAVWCLKYGSPNDTPRGANPLACNICSVRECCPAFAAIRDRLVSFNADDHSAAFRVDTSAGNNLAPNQTFLRCTGDSLYESIVDEFSPADMPAGFNTFPAVGHDGRTLTVGDFVHLY
jgi:hypothetical protein